jgi:hypothetical protein
VAKVNVEHPLNDGDSEGICRLFGYYTSYSEGPVRTLECGYIGGTTTLHDAELLMRSCKYPYELYVLEYDYGNTRVSRYYDEHKASKFHTQRAMHAEVRVGA